MPKKIYKFVHSSNAATYWIEGAFLSLKIQGYEWNTVNTFIDTAPSDIQAIEQNFDINEIIT